MPDIKIWCYTGYLWETVKDFEIMKYIDVLVDGPFIEDLRDISIPWRGSSNQRVIDVKASLSKRTITLL
jgi:anaerobic ribonucleoside-triphosphate reductase activating protein